MNKNIIAIAIIAIGLVVGGIVWSSRAGNEGAENFSAQDAALATFAQCVADKGMTMYGAEWCSHCKKEKAGFGKAFSLIPYVECPDNAKLCLDKGIKGYPTWIAADGAKYEGGQGLARIAEISGCELPAEAR